MSREIELKLEVTPDATERLLARQLLGRGPILPQPQVSVYFDTPDGILRGRGYTLRIRSVGDRFIQTVKSLDGGTGLLDRGEWECQVAGAEPDPAKLASTPLGDVDFARLQPVVRSQVNRRACRLKRAGAELEVDVDHGMLTASGRQLPIHEIEIELLRGKAGAAVALARKIAAEVPVKLGVMSKVERGFALADGALGRASKAEPVPVRNDMTVAQGFEVIVMACIRHFRRNESLVIERRTAKAFHQARVGMRRLRSAFSLFRTAVEDPEYKRLRTELRWFTGELGDARNVDVYLQRRLSDEHRAILSEKREAAYDAAIHAMESNRFRGLVIDLVAWSALGEWRGGARAQQPLGPYVSGRIDRIWKRVSKARRVSKMDDLRRHRLRIRMKKLRYALEFASALHEAGKAKKKFSKSVQAVQESLGDLHDFVIAREIAKSDEWLAVRNDRSKDERATIRRADKDVRRLQKRKPYWRNDG